VAAEKRRWMIKRAPRQIAFQLPKAECSSRKKRGMPTSYTKRRTETVKTFPRENLDDTAKSGIFEEKLRIFVTLKSPRIKKPGKRKNPESEN